VVKRVIKRVKEPQINIKYTVFPHIFLHTSKVFHKSYSFAHKNFPELSTSAQGREKEYNTFFRAPQISLLKNHSFPDIQRRENRDDVRVLALSTKSATPTATTTTPKFIYFYFLFKKERFF
jgi:hypothetical protein